MFINLRRVPDYAGEYPSGIIVAIDPGLPFHNIDGCLQFLRLCLKEIPPRYGKQRDVWTRCLLRISDLAASLRDSRTRFTGKSKDLFVSYCKRISVISEEPAGDTFPAPLFLTMPADQMEAFLESGRFGKDSFGFFYCDKATLETDFNREVTEFLSNLRFPKSSRNLEISYFLRTDGYHEHIHDAVNLLIDIACYAINCTSTRRGTAEGFDVLEVNHRLDHIERIIKEIEHLY